MWQSLAAIGRGSSEIWRRKKKKHHEHFIRPPVTIPYTGGLITVSKLQWYFFLYADVYLGHDSLLAFTRTVAIELVCACARNSLLWRHRVTWRHQWRQHSILLGHFHTCCQSANSKQPPVSAVSEIFSVKNGHRHALTQTSPRYRLKRRILSSSSIGCGNYNY